MIEFIAYDSVASIATGILAGAGGTKGVRKHPPRMFSTDAWLLNNPVAHS
jgi:hypothetical protein